VRGLGPKRTKKIAHAWEEQKAIKEVMVFLSGVGVSTSLAVRIYKKYAGTSISAVGNEPCRLASEVWASGGQAAGGGLRGGCRPGRAARARRR
jgi:exodeoxyribonuclease V alpha subunit